MKPYVWNPVDTDFSVKVTPIKAWTRGTMPTASDYLLHREIEQAALFQLEDTASMPFIYHHLAVMPDVHLGLGATVGSVVPTKGAVIPAAVGVDIGCGMVAARLNLRAEHLPDNLEAVRSAIEAAVPHGRTDNGGANDRGAWGNPPTPAPGPGRRKAGSLYARWAGIRERHGLRWQRRDCAVHAGTLGTGNHFIEVCLDEEGWVWVMLHSGSRGPGNAIGRHFIELAKRDMERWFIQLPNRDLAYLPEGSEHFDDYIRAVEWAQEFAAFNREVMLDATLGAINAALDRWVGPLRAGAVNCHHNYVAREHHFGENVWVTRKGAVRARDGDLGIIPGAMGRRSFIVRGKGNADSFHSCSHGAGRLMSRTEARRTFTVEDHERDTAGLECRKDEGVLDETPRAYKDVDAVMAAQSDLVDIVHTLRAVVCVKG